MALAYVVSTINGYPWRHLKMLNNAGVSVCLDRCKDFLQSRFKVLMAVNMKPGVAWNEKPCRYLDSSWCFGDTCCFPLSTRKTHAAGTSET